MLEQSDFPEATCILVTGGAGFIGSNFVLDALKRGFKVVSVDRLTYAAGLRMLESIESPNYHFVQADISDGPRMANIFLQYQPGAVVNLAAETHVDRSIVSADDFVHSNIVGCHQLLVQALKYWQGLPPSQKNKFRFVHISTDEVYGSLDEEGQFYESSPYSPNSPYSATKAAADHLVRAWHHTHGLPIVIAHPSNNYGPNQHPEKLIPRVIHCCFFRKPIPVYGTGKNVRDWLYVGDFCNALFSLLEHGQNGQSYNIGGNNLWRNIDLVHKICDLFDSLQKRGTKGDSRGLIQMVEDRPGHDYRYAMNCDKFQQLCGWKPLHSVDTGFQKTVQWYLNHVDRLRFS